MKPAIPTVSIPVPFLQALRLSLQLQPHPLQPPQPLFQPALLILVLIILNACLVLVLPIDLLPFFCFVNLGILLFFFKNGQKIKKNHKNTFKKTKTFFMFFFLGYMLLVWYLFCQ